MKEIKAVVDTNIFISSLLKGRTTYKIYEAFAVAKFIPVFSDKTFSELIEVTSKDKFKKYFHTTDIEKLENLIKSDAVFVKPEKSINDCRDPKDNIILECAIASKPDFIVSGDKDLLCLSPYHNIPIITPANFLKLLK